MDLGRTITYNGLTFENSLDQAPDRGAKGYVLDAIDFGNVDAAFYLEKKALQDGMAVADVYLAARTIVIDASIYGSSKGNLWDRHANAMAALSPVVAFNNSSAARGFTPLQFYRPTDVVSTWDTATYPNGIPLEIICRPMAPPTFRIVRDQTGGLASKGGVIRIQSRLVAADPRIYVQDAVELTITSSSQTAVNRGSYPSWPIVTFGLSATGHSAATIAIDGMSVKLDLSGESSGSYTIRYDNRTITDANNVRGDLFDSSFDQRFAQIDGSNSVVRGFNLTGMTSPTLTYTEAFP